MGARWIRGLFSKRDAESTKEEGDPEPPQKAEADPEPPDDAQSGPPFADQPIESVDEDRLRRSKFAARLAAQVEAARKPGLVIALTGPWGSGKTSLLNLVGAQLDREANTIVKFNPWYFSGTEQLIQHFFGEMGSQIAEGSPTAALAKIAPRLKRYGLMLGPLRFIPVAGRWVEMAGEVAKELGDSLSPEAKSLHSQHAELSAELASAGKRVVVLVDDIDRLEDDEIRQVMRLVRLVGDFKNVVYVLAFDAERVATVLGGERGIEEGRRYLEKIVQLSYDTPAIARDDLVGLLKEAIAPLTRAAARDRLDSLVDDVLAPLVENVRDVRRYVNVLPFALDVIGDEVDVVDVLGLEAARVFFPATYDALPEAVDALTTFEDQTRELGERIDAFVATGRGRSATVRAWMDLLFPAVAIREGSRDYDFPSWKDERRVANAEILRIYLEKALPERTVSQAVVSRVNEWLRGGPDAAHLVVGLSEAHLADLFTRARGPDAGAGDDSALSALAQLFNAAGRALGRGFGGGESLALRRFVASYFRRVASSSRCDAARLVVDQIVEVRSQVMVAHELERARRIDAGCASGLRTELGARVAKLPAETLRSTRALPTMFNWLATDESFVPVAHKLLADDEVLVQYLSGMWPPAKPEVVDSMPDVKARLEAVESQLDGLELRRAVSVRRGLSRVRKRLEAS